MSHQRRGGQGDRSERVDDQERPGNPCSMKAGVEGSVALVTFGAGGAIDAAKLTDPIIGLVFGKTSLMYNLTFEGTKFTKLDKY
jgi:hypothetical protein